jgi:RNA polymerase sigma-70 factor (ECF subfamily)
MPVAMETLVAERAHRCAPHRRPAADRIDLDLRVRRLQRIARAILRSDDLALDAVQEALLCLWMEDPRPADVDGWLVRAVVHRSLHQWRSLSRRRRHEALAARERRSPRVSDDPALASRGRELRAQLERALRELPHGYGAAFRLRAIEELDYGEISTRLGVPVGTVRSRLNRARAMLRERLASSFHDERACLLCAKAPRASRLPA